MMGINLKILQNVTVGNYLINILKIKNLKIKYISEGENKHEPNLTIFTNNPLNEQSFERDYDN